MSTFTSAAKNLISLATAQPSIKRGSSVAERLSTLELLDEVGMGPKYALHTLKDIIDDCTEDDKAVKLQATKLLIQVQGMLTPEDAGRVAPVFILNIQGDNTKVNSMLCPGFISG